MTKQYMESYLEIGREIEKEMEKKNRMDIISRDTVRGSSSEFPYTERTFVVSGVSSRSNSSRIDESKLADLKLKQHNVLKEINVFIDNVEEPVMRQILTYKYIAGLSLSEIAYNIRTKDKNVITRDSVKKRLQRFWKNCENRKS